MAKKSSIVDMQFITSSISTMLVLLLLGIVIFFILSANSLSVYVRESIGITVMISEDMKENEIKKFQRKLDDEKFVKSTTYISKEQALKEQTEAMGTDPAEFLGYNPFTASIEVKLNANYANADSIKWIQEKIMKNNKIMEVNYPHDLIDSVNKNIRKLSYLLLGLAALLSLISFALINNTIKLTIHSKRFTIHTMKLVGASWSFIRRPFIIKNIWVGITAAVMANTFLLVMIYLLLKYEPQLISIITLDMLLIILASVFVFGLIITVLCAFISINKYLKMKASAMYYF